MATTTYYALESKKTYEYHYYYFAGLDDAGNVLTTDEPIYVFTKFVPLECSKDFTGWTNTAENVSSEEDAHKLIDNIIKQLKDGYIKHKKEWIEGDFNGYQRCSKSN